MPIIIMIFLVQSVMYQAREKGNNLRKDVTNSAKKIRTLLLLSAWQYQKYDNN